MLNIDICYKCRRRSILARNFGYVVIAPLKGRNGWACPILIKKWGKNSDEHMVTLQGSPPAGCPRMLEHAVAETLKGGN